MMYSTDWTATVTVDGGESWKMRTRANDAKTARDTIRRAVRREYGEDAKIVIRNLRENIYAAGN